MSHTSTQVHELSRQSVGRVDLVGGLYLLVIVGAAVMRFVELGGLPLSPAEAQEALSAWQILQPGSPLLSFDSPAYFTLTSLLMPLLGVSDTVARLVPAVFGLALVTLPWFLREQLGPIGALVAAAFLAASPLNSTISRTAGGDAIALFALLLLAAAAINLRDSRSATWTYLLATALGIGLASSPLFYGGALAFLFSWGVLSGLSRTWPDRPEGSLIRNALIVGAAVFLLLSTRFLTYPAGLGASAQLLGDWLQQFGLGDGLQTMLAPFLVLLRYEGALVVLGTAAVIWAVWKNRAPGLVYTLWLVVSLLLMLAQNGNLSNALLATIPGYLLVGLFSNVLLRKPLGRWSWLLVGGLLLVSAVLLVNLARYLRISVYEQDLSNLWLGVLALAGAALMVYYFWSLSDAAIIPALWTAALIVLLAFEWGTAWRLSHLAANDPRERWVEQSTDDDVHLLLQTLQEISREVTNSDAGLVVLSSVETPVLRWYLRNYAESIIGQAVPPNASQEAVLSPAESPQPLFGADYVGSDFGLLRSGATAAPESETLLQNILRWWLFQESNRAIIEERVILWVRSDLVLPPN